MVNNGYTDDESLQAYLTGEVQRSPNELPLDFFANRKQTQKKTDELDATTGQLQTDVNTVETNVTTIGGDVDGLQQNVSDLNDALATHTHDPVDDTKSGFMTPDMLAKLNSASTGTPYTPPADTVQRRYGLVIGTNATWKVEPSYSSYGMGAVTQTAGASGYLLLNFTAFAGTTLKPIVIASLDIANARQGWTVHSGGVTNGTVKLTVVNAAGTIVDPSTITTSLLINVMIFSQ